VRRAGTSNKVLLVAFRDQCIGALKTEPEANPNDGLDRAGSDFCQTYAP
jgi:hypothetical protein